MNRRTAIGTWRVLLLVCILAVLGSFGRSPQWLAFPSVVFLLGLTASVPLVRSVIQLIFGGFFRSHLILTGLFLASLAITVSYLLTPTSALPIPWLYLPFVLFWHWLVALSLVSSVEGAKATRTLSVLFNLGLTLTILLVLSEAFLQVTFNNLPAGVRYRMPQYQMRSGIVFDDSVGARRFPAHQAVSYSVDGRSGDLYELTCLPRPADPLFAAYTVSFTRDAQGFRNPDPPPDHADLVIAGDSFTAAEMVQQPFWMGITPSVYALGLPDSGTLEQLALLNAYGFKRTPRVVVLAYFGGNDMQNNWDYQRIRAEGESFNSRDLADASPLELLVLPRLMAWMLRPVPTCPYPVTDVRGDRLAFYDSFFANAMLSSSALSQTDQLAVTRDAILKVAEQTRAAGAVFVLMYMPYKAQTYWDLLRPEDIDAMRQRLPPESFGYDPRSAELLTRAGVDAMRLLLAGFAQQYGFLFLDLTPGFRAAASDGASLYFYGDTHWNQAGHDLARAALASFLHDHGLLE